MALWIHCKQAIMSFVVRLVVYKNKKGIQINGCPVPNNTAFGSMIQKSL